MHTAFSVMAGLVPAIHVFADGGKSVDARDIQREDALRAFAPGMTERDR
jgi:hypothetical protein